MTARGIRNNNPGNIRQGAAWEGELPHYTESLRDPDFCVFSSMPYGVRAIAKILLTYQALPPKGHGLRTIRALINRWAPSEENDTSAYVTAVSAACGVSPDADFPLSEPSNLFSIIRAIIHQENGPDAALVSNDDINQGIALS